MGPPGPATAGPAEPSPEPWGLEPPLARPSVVEIRLPPRPVEPPAPPPRRGPRWRWPLALFVLTCLSTYVTWGFAYAFWVMVALTAHELGHYFQARRFRVPVSLPYFIPLPLLSPFGTLGAVIAMPPHTPNRRVLFDIAATGPIAGLIPSLVLCAVGLSMSEIRPADDPSLGGLAFGEPLVLQWMANAILGVVPEGSTIVIHPVGFAGWVGLFVTGLNLLPVGQLDGGHILYALLRKRAHEVSSLLLSLVSAAVVVAAVAHFVYDLENYFWSWWLFVGLLHLIGARHPPTLDDAQPLGRGRTVLGWLLLLFVVVGLSPQPLIPKT